MDWQNTHIQLAPPCGRQYCEPDWCRPRSDSMRLSDLELWLAWKGVGWMQTAQARFEVRPGFCCLMRPGGIYDAGQDESSRLGITYIHFQLLTPSGQVFPADQTSSLREFWSWTDLAYMEPITRRIVELFNRPGGQTAAAALLGGLLMDLFLPTSSSIETSSAHARWRPAIHAIAEEIKGHPAAKHSIAALAERIGLSPAYFSRIFTAEIGMSPQAFAMRARIDQARHMLLESNLSVTRISELLGYEDVYFFSRQFHQLCNQSPTEYRLARGRNPSESNS